MSNIKRYNGSSWVSQPIDADTLGGKAPSSFQDKLVSGTNIKTINGSNILGSGNITISTSVPTASSTTLGGIKIGFNNSSNLSNYPVQLDASNKAYVNIPIYYYEGATYGECHEIDAPSYEYSMAIGTSGFTVDSGVPGGNTGSSNILQVDSDKFTYNGNQVITSGNLKTINGNSLVGSGDITISASVPKATTSTIGGIKLGHSNTNKDYAVQLDANGAAYVKVSWTDTTYPDALRVISSSANHFYGYKYNNNNWGIEIYSGSVGNFPSIGPGGYSQKNVSVPFTHSSGESKYFLVVRGSKALIVRLVSKSSNGFTLLLYNPESSSTIANDIYVDWIGVKTW